MNSYAKGLTIATAVGALLGATGCGSDGSDDPAETTQSVIRCQGINECAGLSECASSTGANECQGLNECKGMGWLSVDTEDDCTEQGGTVLAS